MNVARLGERFIAMTETPMPVQFDPQTLETAGVALSRRPGELTTAHPHLDRASGGMLNYAAKLGPRSSYRFFSRRTATRSEPQVIASLPVREPAYMHSFGLTERWLVLAEFPFVVNPLALALSGRPYIENYRWKPELGTRFTLFDRATGEARGGFRPSRASPFTTSTPTRTAMRWSSTCAPSPTPASSRTSTSSGCAPASPSPRAELTRFRLDLPTGSVARERLVDEDLELPRINYARCNERPYRYAWGAGDGRAAGSSGSSRSTSSDGATLRGPSPAATRRAGVRRRAPTPRARTTACCCRWCSTRTAAARSCSCSTPRDLGELARAAVPHHIPFGFHGQFARTRGASSGAQWLARRRLGCRAAMRKAV